MIPNLTGFRQFLEKSDSKYDLDSLGTTAWELGIDPNDLASQPFVGANFSFGGKKLMAGLASYDIVKIDPNIVVLRVKDEGTKRLLKDKSGTYARDPSMPNTPRTIVMPRSEFVKMWDAQYGQSQGAMAGMPAGGPPQM